MAYLAYWRRADPFWAGIRTVMSIHNLAYQGRFSYRLFEQSDCHWMPGIWKVSGTLVVSIFEAPVRLAASAGNRTDNNWKPFNFYRGATLLSVVMLYRIRDLYHVISDFDYLPGFADWQ